MPLTYVKDFPKKLPTTLFEQWDLFPSLLLEEKKFLIEIEKDFINPLLELDRLITEENLSPDKIEDLFNRLETNLKVDTRAAVSKYSSEDNRISNRTVIGKSKDVYNKIKSLIEGEKFGFIKSFDEKMDASYKRMIEAGDKGNKTVIYQAITKWKALGNKYPLTQAIIWAVVTILVGLFTGGASAAVILGTLKFADRLLMGEKFSSAAIKGILTGGAASLMQHIKHQFAANPKLTVNDIVSHNNQLYKDISVDKLAKSIPQDGNIGGIATITCQPSPDLIVGGKGPSFGEAFKAARKALGANHVFQWHGGYYTTNLAHHASNASAHIADFNAKEILGELGGKKLSTIHQMIGNAFGGKDLGVLSANEINSYYLHHGVATPEYSGIGFKESLEESLLIEGIFSKLEAKLKNLGNNLTNKITAEKLTKAWTEDGSPTDSEEVKDFLIGFLIHNFGEKYAITAHKIVAELMPEPIASEPKKEYKILKDFYDLDDYQKKLIEKVKASLAKGRFFMQMAVDEDEDRLEFIKKYIIAVFGTVEKFKKNIGTPEGKAQKLDKEVQDELIARFFNNLNPNDNKNAYELMTKKPGYDTISEFFREANKKLDLGLDIKEPKAVLSKEEPSSSEKEEAKPIFDKLTKSQKATLSAVLQKSVNSNFEKTLSNQDRELIKNFLIAAHKKLNIPFKEDIVRVTHKNIILENTLALAGLPTKNNDYKKLIEFIKINLK